MTGPSRGGAGPRAFIDLSLRLAGAKPCHLSPARPYRPAGVAGVVVSGGHDVDPVLYAQSPRVRPRYDPERDAFESTVIGEAIEQDLPLLGICRGAQLINVCLGGSLHQDLRSRRLRTSGRRTLLPLKTALLEPGTGLHRLLDTPSLRINSLHDQSIDRLGVGLRVAARDRDGIVQAVEAPERDYLIGVQWHPEFLLCFRRQRRLFSALVRAARRRTAV